MDTATKKKIWDFHYHLSKTQAALIDADMTDIERKIREHVEVLRYFVLLMEYPDITAVTGAQGVGKSYHVNQMCEIPEDQRLLSSLGRAEKIPVFMMRRREKTSLDVRLYKRRTPTGNTWFEFEDLSYEEARERVAKPEDDDLCMFWYGDGNATLASLEPIAVLPGFEYKTPWEMAIRILLDLSDSVIYVTDQSRSAMDVSSAIEEKISELNLKSPTVVLLSKVDDMAKKKIDEFASRFQYESVPVGIVSAKSSKISKRKVCSQEQYDDLLQKLGEHLAGRGVARKTAALEDAIDKALMYLNDARAETDKLEIASSAGIIRSIDTFLDRQDEIWEKVIRVKVLDHAEAVSEKAADQAYRASKPMIEKEFDKKIRVRWNGGVTLSFANDLQDRLRDEFTESTGNLHANVSNELSRISNQKAKKLLAARNSSFDDVMKVGRELMLVDTVIAPLGELQSKMSSDLTEILQNGKEALKEVGGMADQAGEIASSIQPMVEAIGKEKGRQKLLQEIQRMPSSQRAEAVKGLVTTGLGSAGAAASAAEIAGAGFTGATMSVVAGVLGGVVAGLAVGSWLMSVTRTANKTEFMVDDFARRCAQAMSEQVQSSLSTRLDRFWEAYRFHIKQSLVTNTGVAQHEERIILLGQATHSALEEGKSLKKSLVLASDE